MGDALRGRARLGSFLAVSMLLHALVLAAMAHRRAEPVHDRPRLFPISLIGGPGAQAGGGAGNGHPALAEPTALADARDAPSEAAIGPEPPAPRVVGTKRPTPVARPRPARLQVTSRPKPAAGRGPAAHDGANGDGQGDGGTGGPGGGGREGGVAYGANPAPPYPLAARRSGVQGMVLLDVLVAADGRPVDVQVATSSGHAMLDDAALTTVRDRWRFVAAVHDGIPIASRVRVPLRFRLTNDRGSEPSEESPADEPQSDGRTAKSGGAPTDETPPGPGGT